MSGEHRFSGAEQTILLFVLNSERQYDYTHNYGFMNLNVNHFFILRKPAFESGQLFLRYLFIYRPCHVPIGFANPYYKKCTYRPWDHFRLFGNRKPNHCKTDFKTYFCLDVSHLCFLFILS